MADKGEKGWRGTRREVKVGDREMMLVYGASCHLCHLCDLIHFVNIDCNRSRLWSTTARPATTVWTQTKLEDRGFNVERSSTIALADRLVHWTPQTAQNTCSKRLLSFDC